MATMAWTRPLCTLLAAVALLVGSAGFAESRWGANYFPNVELTTHDGETVRFFDDLIKDRIVAINFIYTSCPDVCPLETAYLVRVQDIIGDRLGDDIFFYSISIDPKVDTPAVLKSYRNKFGAKWTFLTGAEQDIVSLRRKLGLYIEDIQDGSLNHNVHMIIGNQTTGRWMKRSPFESPHVLADQMENWLASWKAVPTDQRDYAEAPTLRKLSDGEKLYRSRCMSCHSIDGSTDNPLGPDLLGVTERRDRKWLVRWLKEPDAMLADGDPIATALYEEYGGIAMPNLRLSLVDVNDLLRFLRSESRDAVHPSMPNPGVTDVVAVMNAWVREPPFADADVVAGYMTLINVGDRDEAIVGVASSLFERVEVHEMAPVNGLMEMVAIETLTVPAGGRAELEPGGQHLMLKQPSRPIVSGDKVDLTLTFASGARQELWIIVAN